MAAPARRAAKQGRPAYKAPEPHPCWNGKPPPYVPPRAFIESELGAWVGRSQQYFNGARDDGGRKRAIETIATGAWNTLSPEERAEWEHRERCHEAGTLPRPPAKPLDEYIVHDDPVGFFFDLARATERALQRKPGSYETFCRYLREEMAED